MAMKCYRRAVVTVVSSRVTTVLDLSMRRLVCGRDSTYH
jgi:hypothetical protein